MLDKYKNFLFFNADEAAKRLNPSNIDEVKLAAGKETIKKIYESLNKKLSFIWESTISGKNALKVIKSAKKQKYKILLLYIFVDNPQICIDRVQARSLKGGHLIPQEDIVRRYYRSKKNFFEYLKFVDDWILFYNGSDGIIEIANPRQIRNASLYQHFKKDL
jgi:predicted ABC-type ATPase